jgi:hypothetical protein
MFKRYCIDFLHLKNNGHKGKSRGAYSNAVFDEPLDNNKYWSDFIFCFMGKVYKREIGEPGKHLDRKHNQLKRMKHWESQGHCDVLIIDSMEMAKKDWKYILKDKYLEIGE